jgi:hypothetical protein
MRATRNRLLASVRSAAEYVWVVLETAFWMALAVWLGLLLRFYKWRIARLEKDRDAFRLEY